MHCARMSSVDVSLVGAKGRDLELETVFQHDDDAKVRTRLYDDFNIEIGAGLGPLKGQVWRVGLMGYSSRRENVTLLLGALREILRD